VPQTEEVPVFMGAFFGYAVNKVIIIPIPAIILVSQPGGGYNSSTDLLQTVAGQVRPRIYRVRCRNGKYKRIQFQPVTLKDGNQYSTYNELALE